MSSSRESSQQHHSVISHGNSGNAVQDVLFFIRDTHFETVKDKGLFTVWLEQLSWMLLLQSHRRVPDCETLSAQQSRSSSPLSGNNKKNNHSSTTDAGNNKNPIVRFSVVTSPDASSIDASRNLHSELTQHFFNDDSHRHLVDVAPSITCHRALSSFYPDPRKKQITLADISAPSSCSTSRGPSPGNDNNNIFGNNNNNNMFSKINTIGKNPDAKTESLEDAKDRLVEFFMNLVGCMNPAEINRSPVRALAHSINVNNSNNKKKKAAVVRDSDSDSSEDNDSDDDDDASSFHLEDDEDRKIGKAALSSRQVIFVVCNEFVYNHFSDRCNVSSSTQECFMWARSRGQVKWYSPSLWNENSLNCSSNATPKLLPAEITPPPSAALSKLMMSNSCHDHNDNNNNHQSCCGLENVVNNENVKESSHNNDNNNNITALAVDQSIAFVEEPNPSKPDEDEQKHNNCTGTTGVQQKNSNNKADDDDDELRSPSKQFHQMTNPTTVKSPSAEKEFRLESSSSCRPNENDEFETTTATTEASPNRWGSESRKTSVDRQEENDVVAVANGKHKEEENQQKVILPPSVKKIETVAVITSPTKKKSAMNNTSAVAVDKKENAFSRQTQQKNTIITTHQQQSNSTTTTTPRYALATRTSSIHNNDRRTSTPNNTNHTSSRSTSSSNKNIKTVVAGPPSASLMAPLRRSSPVTSTTATSSRTGSRASTPNTNNKNQRSGVTSSRNSNNNSRKSSPVVVATTSVVGHLHQRSGEVASSQLYKMGTFALKRKQELERQAEEKRREKEEEEMRKIRQPHPHLTMYNQNPSDVKRVRGKIVHALRADPNSEEGLQLIPNLPDKLPMDRVCKMVTRLAPSPNRLSIREEQKLKLEEQKKRQSSRSATPNNKDSSCRSSRSATPPAWRGGGVVAAAPSSSMTSSSRSSTPVHQRKENSSSSAAVSSSSSRPRSNSPSVHSRLYQNRNCSKEAQTRQRQMQDLREVEEIIETRKMSNPTWLNMVRKDPSVEDQYRKRLLRTRQEERRLNEQREINSNRNPDPRYPPASVSTANPII